MGSNKTCMPNDWSKGSIKFYVYTGHEGQGVQFLLCLLIGRSQGHQEPLRTAGGVAREWNQKECRHVKGNEQAWPVFCSPNSSPASFPASRWGSWALWCSRHCENSHFPLRWWDGRFGPHREDFPQRWGAVHLWQGWTSHKHQRQSELGHNRSTGETPVTDEQVTPREAKWLSQGVDKKAECCVYSSATMPLELYHGSDPLRISSKCTGSRVGLRILHFKYASESCGCPWSVDHTWEARVYNT